MGWISLSCTTLWLGLMNSQVAAAQSDAAVRRVQIISMTPGAGPAEVANAASDPAPAEELAAPSSSTNFQTHDISRRWVAFEMEHSFATFAADRMSEQSAIDPFAGPNWMQLNPAEQSFNSSAPPSIIIPAWMKSGLAFSTEATRFVPICMANTYRPTGFLDRNAESRRSEYYATMSAAACEYGIPVGLFDAMIIRESRYKADAYSPKRAFGLTQLMPDTADILGVNRFDIEQNLRGGARYLRRQLDTFGQVHLALAAYNAGPGRVRRGLIPRIAQTQAYVDNVIQNWKRLVGRAGVSGISNVSMRSRPPPMRIARTVVVSSY